MRDTFAAALKDTAPAETQSRLGVDGDRPRRAERNLAGCPRDAAVSKSPPMSADAI
jgi:hypothetical protein